MTARPADPPGAGVLPLAALVLARRVRALVAVTVVRTTVLAVAAWLLGNGPTLPSVAGFAAHLAISLGAALPVRWQFAGDPALREHRAVRAMTVSFVILAVYSAVDAVIGALAPARPGETLVGGLLGLAAAVALPVLVALDARASRADGADRDPRVGPAAPPVLVVALSAVLVAASGVDLLASTAVAPSVATPAVSAVVAVLAAREAWGAWNR